MTLAIGIYQPRKRGEVEDLRRAVKGYMNPDTDFTFQVGGFRVDDVAGIPHINYRDLDRFQEAVGPVLDIIALELDTHALPLSAFEHPTNVAYLLGANTGYIPRDVLDRIGRIVQVETPGHAALNTAAVAAIVIHDRYATQSQEAVA